MKQILSFFLLLIVSAFFTGCITSATPNPEKTIIMKPGDEQLFMITIHPFIYTFRPVINYGIKIDNEIYEYLDKEWPTYAYDTYSPEVHDAGKHEISILVSVRDFAPQQPAPEPLWRDSRTWNVIVCGIQGHPETDTTISPGESMVFNADAYPEGEEYEFEWYLNDNLLANTTGDSFEYVAEAEVGTIQTIEAKTLIKKDSYSYSWKIYVE